MVAQPAPLSAPSEALSLKIGTSNNPERKTLGTKASASESDRADIFGREGKFFCPQVLPTHSLKLTYSLRGKVS
jgi:hypothetical protein